MADKYSTSLRNLLTAAILAPIAACAALFWLVPTETLSTEERVKCAVVGAVLRHVDQQIGTLPPDENMPILALSPTLAPDLVRTIPQWSEWRPVGPAEQTQTRQPLVEVGFDRLGNDSLLSCSFDNAGHWQSLDDVGWINTYGAERPASSVYYSLQTLSPVYVSPDQSRAVLWHQVQAEGFDYEFGFNTPCDVISHRVEVQPRGHWEVTGTHC